MLLSEPWLIPYDSQHDWSSISTLELGSPACVDGDEFAEEARHPALSICSV